MCCVDKKNWKFMGCMDLTTATLVIGIVLIVKAILCLVFGGYTNVYTLIFGIFCCLVIRKPHSIRFRKFLVILFWIEIILLVIGIVWMIIAILDINRIYDCSDNGSFGDNCDHIKTYFYVFLGINVAIGVTLDVMIGQMVINGKRQQIEYHEK